MERMEFMKGNDFLRIQLLNLDVKNEDNDDLR